MTKTNEPEPDLVAELLAGMRVDYACERGEDYVLACGCLLSSFIDPLDHPVAKLWETNRKWRCIESCTNAEKVCAYMNETKMNEMNKEDQQLLVDLDGAVREDLFLRVQRRLLALAKLETYLRQHVIPELECLDEYAKEFEEFLPDDHEPIAPRLKKAVDEVFK